jgi:hypothetical protein
LLYLCTAFAPQKGVIRAKVVLENILKKTFQNIWWFQKNGLSLHRFSALKIAGIKIEVLMQIRI